MSPRSIQSFAEGEKQIMNEDRLKGNWKQLKGKVREQWGKLTDDELDVIEGRKEMLVGKLQEHYGITREEAERRFKEFEKRNEALYKNAA
jgi:uncharacterized protein YjbJ (UPF0337 family)